MPEYPDPQIRQSGKTLDFRRPKCRQHKPTLRDAPAESERRKEKGPASLPALFD
jgi:hypothetical protein